MLDFFASPPLKRIWQQLVELLIGVYCGGSIPSQVTYLQIDLV
jgi:hypothetical protein